MFFIIKCLMLIKNASLPLFIKIINNTYFCGHTYFKCIIEYTRNYFLGPNLKLLLQLIIIYEIKKKKSYFYFIDILPYISEYKPRVRLFSNYALLLFLQKFTQNSKSVYNPKGNHEYSTMSAGNNVAKQVKRGEIFFNQITAK